MNNLKSSSTSNEHLDNIYRVLNEHSALIRDDQQSIAKLSQEMLEVLKVINKNMAEINSKLNDIEQKFDNQ